MRNDRAEGIIDVAIEGWKEGRSEYLKSITPIADWSDLIDDFDFSPLEFYQRIVAELEKRQVPDLLIGTTLLRESTPFSPKRLYLQLRRERFVFEIGAAQFGSSWAVSWRLFDRRRGAKFADFLAVAIFVLPVLMGLTLVFNMPIVALIVGTGIALLWSIMRWAARGNKAYLDELIGRIPFVGRIYESIFHPETFFRLDQREMYRLAVQRSVKKVLTDLGAQKGNRSLAELDPKPILRDLYRR